MYNNNNNSNLPSTPSSSLSFDNNSNSSTTNNNGQIPQLWMGELDQRWDELTIKQIWTSLLSSLGIVVHSVKLIKDKQSSQLGLANAGYCFIRFHNFEDASKVLNNFNGKPIPGTNNQHYFRLNWSSANIQAAAIAAAANSSLPLTTSSNPIEYSIFVGDLPQNINEQILLQTFKMKYPSCTSVKIMVDQSTGNIKGYGFVKFLNEDEQKKALIEMQGYILLGRAIRVSTASKSNSSLPNSLSNNSNSSVNINQVLSPSKLLSTNYSNSSTQLPQQSQQIYSQQPLIQQSNLNISSSLPNNIIINSNNSTTNNNNNNRSLLQPLPQNNSLQYFNDPANTTVFIGGLNVPFTEKQMFELFSKYGSISYVKIPAGKNCGFVQYFHRESAEMAINEMQGYDIGGGCKIRVSWGARAAQRSWFARQLQMQQQAQQVQQLSINQFNNTNSNSNTNLDQLSNNDISMLLNMTKNSNITENLGLFDSYTNLNINDAMINLNGYSVNQYNFQNEQIPFTNNTNPNVVDNDTIESSKTNENNNNNNNNNNSTNFNSNDELKLNKLLLAARDGNLDQLDLGSNIYN